MSYQVPQHIADSKIFLTNFSEVQGGRLDPKLSLYNRKIQHFAFPKVKLKTLLKKSPQYGANEAGIPRINKEDPRYIRITDIDENGFIPVNELGATSEKVEDKYILNEDDILFARSGATVGKTYIHKNLSYKCFFAGYLIRFVINSQLAIPDYVFLYTQLAIYKEWVNAIQRPSGQPNINAEEYLSLEIPLPDIKVQKELVNIYKLAIREKQQKEEQADALLQSIDDYLLGELGIQLPEAKSQTIQDRMFVMNYSEVNGDRLDAEYNNPHKHGVITAALKSAKYSKASLTFVAKDIFQGVGKDETDDSTYVLLKVKNILRGNMIDYSDVEFVKSIPQNKLLLRNDIISPFIGEAVRQIKFSLFDKDEYKYTVDNNTGVIRLKESVNAQYVCEYLCSCLGKMQIERLIGGGGVPFLGTSGAKKLNIVIPPLQKQQEIVNHISSIRQQAKVLQEEGNAILEQAKKEVEQMILGQA